MVFYAVSDLEGLKLLTRLRLGFRHLKKHRFQHNFQESINPLSTSSLGTKKNLSLPIALPSLHLFLYWSYEYGVKSFLVDCRSLSDSKVKSLKNQ